MNLNTLIKLGPLEDWWSVQALKTLTLSVNASNRVEEVPALECATIFKHTNCWLPIYIQLLLKNKVLLH